MRRWPALVALVPALVVGGPVRAVTASGGSVQAVTAPGGSARAVTATGDPARVLTLTSGPARAVTLTGGRYVALGDSFTAGPFIPHRHGTPIACLRSDHNYPSLVARMLQPASFTDVSCSAATTADLSRSQSVLFGHNKPQLDAVTRDTTLVTIGIGGNDIGYSRIVLTCAAFSLTDHRGAPCRRYYGTTLDRRIDDTAPKIAAILRAVHDRAPRARVLLVGYPRMLPSRTGCWPNVPTAVGDIPFLDRFERHLNTMLAAEARRGDARFVDAYTTARHHDMCSADRWVEGILIKNPAAPVHPNAKGMQAVADRVLAVLGASRVSAD
ncbi:SGNH/GDSL hydrolase family protein [Actinoallomurus spadix]|uniref:SGNH/GDSL hydrolase family protein n=1 Tax=Actinoallomurus spadix TaxID=79912 RepID=A0ABN0WEE4_9ACTN|nr:SGNH/GDSL hydrolase family protein [Actinoallomurus spadix]MCO5987255.1 SGNH/GDSL hydrolase family protein [Actinoallomurus spadix]